MKLCDFCGMGPTSHSLRSRSHPQTEVIASAEEHWVACPICYAFIVDGDRLGLLQRAIDVYRRKSPKTDMSSFESTARAAQERFWMTRIE